MGSKLGPTIEDVARSEERLRTTRRNLILVLEARCGTGPEALVAQINGCEDVSRLQDWIRQVVRTQPHESIRLE